jgi:hypothetical protein
MMTGQMSRARTFLALPSIDKLLLIESALSLAATRVALALLPYRTVTDIIDFVSARLPSRSSPPPLGRVAWAVNTASRHVPGVNSCLVRALTARVILMRRQRDAVLHYGVAWSGPDSFEAHAWVESDGVVVVGSTESERFTPLSIRAPR